jgi:hypothetical protein
VITFKTDDLGAFEESESRMMAKGKGLEGKWG